MGDVALAARLPEAEELVEVLLALSALLAFRERMPVVIDAPPSLFHSMRAEGEVNSHTNQLVE